MSRSNNTELTNPAKRFYRWDGDKGGFQYFDKTRGEKGERVAIPFPFRFMVLDTLSTIRGYNDAENSGYWSNEIRDIKKDILTVKTKSGECCKGLYEEVITSRYCSGAKYCQSVYIAVKEDDGPLVVCNIQMVGAAVGAWIEFRKKNKVLDGAVVVESFIEGKKGKTVYQIPVFKKIEVTEETERIANDLDKELQTYLDKYLAKTKQEIADKHIEEKATTESFPPVEVNPCDPLGTQNDKDDLPF
jgi:hypothetical protein